MHLIFWLESLITLFFIRFFNVEIECSRVKWLLIGMGHLKRYSNITHSTQWNLTSIPAGSCEQSSDRPARSPHKLDVKIEDDSERLLLASEIDVIRNFKTVSIDFTMLPTHILPPVKNIATSGDAKSALRPWFQRYSSKTSFQHHSYITGQILSQWSSSWTSVYIIDSIELLKTRPYL